MRASKARRMRGFLEAVADFLEDGEALEAVELFRVWSSEGTYQKGLRVQHEGVLYRCLQEHQAQPGWDPVDAPDLWAPVLAVPVWVQAESAEPYQKGDRVMHNGRVWVSLCDDNTWEPGAEGWEEAE